MQQQLSPKRKERATGAVRQAYKVAGANTVIATLRATLVDDLRAARHRRDRARARQIEADLDRLRGIELMT